MIFHARSDADAKASPGGSMSAFCEPVSATSIPQASTGMSHTPIPVIASHTVSASELARTASTRVFTG